MDGDKMLRAIALLCWLGQVLGAGLQPRNVLLMIADDAGFESGTYGNKICQTPNIDSLARRAVIFNEAFVTASSCSPSRAALLTGQPSHQSGMYGLHHSVHHFNVFNNVSSLPAVLAAAGVYTGIIGKKHVGPREVFRFDYEQTEENNRIDQVGRNITRMKLLTREFLRRAAGRSFFLYVGFHDPHRCGHVEPQFGSFCERFGSGEPGTGVIPDWTPWYYSWDEIQPPYFVPDTETARRDLAAQYTTISRLDQGIGLVLRELGHAGRADDTLVLFTSDNGPPFPGGRTSLHDAGVRVPLLVASPLRAARRNQVSRVLTSHLDLRPTLLAWYGVRDPSPAPVEYARNLLPVLEHEPPPEPRAAVFLSQTHHEVTMYYPMRAVRTQRYKLLHNINFRMPFPVDQDLYVSPTFQDILNRTRDRQPLPWYTTLQRYYWRPQWELYDVRVDPAETRNLHGKAALTGVENELRVRLLRWQHDTGDPWRCAPDGVLERDECRPLYNLLTSF